MVNHNGNLPNTHEDWMSGEFIPGLVSVIIPSHNRAVYLLESMDSVFEQTYRPIELIIVDDGSTDDSEAIIEIWKKKHADDHELSVIYLYQENSGAPVARNRGLRKSHGEFIQYLDSDDVLGKDKLKLQASALNADPKLDFVYSETSTFTDKHDFNVTPMTGFKCHCLLPNFINDLLWNTQSGIYRRDACRRIGPWNEYLRIWQDRDYHIRFACLNPRIGYVPGLLSLCREHNYGQISDLNTTSSGVRNRMVSMQCILRYLGEERISQTAYGNRIAHIYYRIMRYAMALEEEDIVLEAYAMSTQQHTNLHWQLKVRILWTLYRILGGKTCAAFFSFLGRIKGFLDNTRMFLKYRYIRSK
jgi:glycosyltransferase involved in cell wall biosynthesis